MRQDTKIHPQGKKSEKCSKFIGKQLCQSIIFKEVTDWKRYLKEPFYASFLEFSGP